MPTQRRRARVDLTNHAFKPRFIDGQELANWRDVPDITDYIKQLMDEGWHLTGAASGWELILERKCRREW